jgi:hypothetical protein
MSTDNTHNYFALRLIGTQINGTSRLEYTQDTSFTKDKHELRAMIEVTLSDGIALDRLTVDCYQLAIPGAEPSDQDALKWSKSAKEWLAANPPGLNGPHIW